MNTRRYGSILAAAILLVPLSSCSSTTSIDVSAVCAEVDSRSTIPTCEGTYDEGDAIHIPEQRGDQTIGAFTRGAAAFATATQQLKPTAEVKATVAAGRKYANTIYQATVVDGTVTAVTAVLTVPDDLIMSALLGGQTLIGTISPKSAEADESGEPVFDFDPSYPVAIELDESADNGTLQGVIRNATTTALVGSQCLPALNSQPQNPLIGDFSDVVELSRAPSMHAEFEDELVLAWTDSSSGMGAEIFPTVAGLFGGDSMSAEWSVAQHGVPSSGPSLTLTVTADAVSQCS